MVVTNCCIPYSQLNFITCFFNISTNFLSDVVENSNTMHRFAPLLYFICWLLHVSAVVCHLQGASGMDSPYNVVKCHLTTLYGESIPLLYF
jgi:hypothetical protein